MGFFSKKKKPRAPKPPHVTSSATTASSEQATSPGAKDTSNPATPSSKAKFEFAFDCCLAHGSETKTIRNFKNIRELYQQMAQALGININNILFVTVNTPKCDMTKLLGGQIMFGDFLYVHLSTPSTTLIEVEKTSQMFGLTITDNGNGQAFVKGKRAKSILEHVEDILPGDAILSINGEAMIGKRHIDVAKTLRQIQLGTMVSFVLQPPIRGMNQISGRTAKKVSGDVNKAGMTVRIKKDGETEVVAADDACKVEAIKILDEMLEDYVGIRDKELCQAMYDSGDSAADSSVFNGEMQSNYPMFSFSDEFVLDAWAIISESKCGRMPKKKQY